MRFSPQWDLPHIANFTGRQHFPIATLMRHGDDPMRFAKTLATERNTRGADRTRLDCFSVGWIEYRSFQKTQRRMELGQSPAIAPLRPIRLRPCVQRLLYGSRSMSSPFDETNPKFQNGKDNADHSSASFQTWTISARPQR